MPPKKSKLVRGLTVIPVSSLPPVQELTAKDILEVSLEYITEMDIKIRTFERELENLASKLSQLSQKRMQSEHLFSSLQTALRNVVESSRNYPTKNAVISDIEDILRNATSGNVKKGAYAGNWIQESGEALATPLFRKIKRDQSVGTLMNMDKEDSVRILDHEMTRKSIHNFESEHEIPVIKDPSNHLGSPSKEEPYEYKLDISQFYEIKSATRAKKNKGGSIRNQLSDVGLMFGKGKKEGIEGKEGGRKEKKKEFESGPITINHNQTIIKNKFYINSHGNNDGIGMKKRRREKVHTIKENHKEVSIEGSSKMIPLRQDSNSSLSIKSRKRNQDIRGTIVLDSILDLKPKEKEILVERSMQRSKQSIEESSNNRVCVMDDSLECRGEDRDGESRGGEREKKKKKKRFMFLDLNKNPVKVNLREFEI